jgi:glycosyltransferase involved in cell wall biosynthesis
VPVYNAEKYIKGCLESILSQGYPNYELCVIDDCSKDNTWNIIGDVCNKIPFNMCRNEYRITSPLANIVKAIELFALDREDVVCIVDGDDKLAHNDVLSDLSHLYLDGGVWFTYGQFVPLSGKYGAYCKEIKEPHSHRKDKLWYASHLKTFKRKLFDKINDDDLRDEKGDYFRFIGDACLVYPMVEMCGTKHMRFIDKVNYLYNDLNPLNEMSVNMQEQLRLSDLIWSRPQYKELSDL